ncbi:MFS transporter [Sporomusa sp. GT1]|uniref:MFS transporter n=1 Tax=Sporomusa sp. GT1 TaxID=1534747 RepID=UPI001665CA62|nr:MFS transporter [Sporomusa sp. GT1]
MQWLILLKINFAFRRLWLSQCISSIGDWFNHVAMINMVLQLTGTGLSVAFIIACRTIPLLLAGPWLSAWIDRLDKKRIMVAADVLRALFVLGYLFIREPDDLWIAYSLSGCLALGTVLFDAARLAYMPQIVAAEKLVTVNSIYSFTFGVTIAFGALAGGWIVSLLGNNSAFIVNAATFIVSGLLISGITGKSVPNKRQAGKWVGTELAATWRWLRGNPAVLLLLATDASLAISSGIMNVLLGIFALQVFSAGSLGLGVFYLALGLGFIGGSLAIMVVKARYKSVKASWTIMSWALMGIGAALAGFSQSFSLFAAAGILVVTYIFQGIFGVLYNTLLMLFVPADIRGKVFALDKIKLAVIMSLSALGAGYMLEVISPRVLAAASGCFIILCGLIWTAVFKLHRLWLTAEEGEEQHVNVSV